MDYNAKYNKYKNKYLKLKNQIGSSKKRNIEFESKTESKFESYENFKPILCNENIFYSNYNKSCANISIQIMLLFSENTTKQVQYNLLYGNIDKLITDATPLLVQLLPYYLLSDDITILPDKTVIFLKNLIGIIKDRFTLKQDIYSESSEEYTRQRSDSISCGNNLHNLWFNTFGVDIFNYTQPILFANILSTILLNKFILVEDIYDNKKINLINYNTITDLVKEYKFIGYMITTSNHAISCYYCDNKIFINNNGHIIEFDFDKFINNVYRLINNNEKFDIYINFQHHAPYIKDYSINDNIYFTKKVNQIPINDEIEEDVVKNIFECRIYDNENINDIKSKFINTYIRLYNQHQNIDPNIKYLKYYIKNNNLPNTIYNTVLLDAIINNNNYVITYLLNNKLVNYNLQDNMGATILYNIILQFKNIKNIAVIKLLIKITDCNIQDKYGYTPLHIAIHENVDIEIIKLLIENTNCNLQNKYGETPLHIAIHKNVDSEIIKLLKEIK